MRILTTLLGIGALVAGAKVAQKYAENKKNAAAADAVPVSGHIVDDMKKAATDVFDDAGDRVRKAAESVGIDTADLTSSLSDAGKAVADAGKAVGATIAAEAPAFVEHVKDTISSVRSDIASGMDDIELDFNDCCAPQADTAEDAPVCPPQADTEEGAPVCANEDETFAQSDDPSAPTY